MSVYYTICTTSQADHVCDPCPPKELGDIRSYFFVKSSFTFTDISDPAEWTVGLNDRDIYIIAFSRGTFTSAENLQPGFGDSAEELDGYDHEGIVFDPNYAANCNFYNDIKRSKEWKWGYRTETKVHLSDVIATVIPKAPIQEGKVTSVIWEVTVKFTQEDIPCPFDIPPGVFDQCIGV